MREPRRVDPFDFVRTIAVARLMMPRAQVRLSAGRQAMSDELQALCFLAGANSIFYGEKLLTTGNPDVERDRSSWRGSASSPKASQETSRILPSIPRQPAAVARNDETAA